MFTLIMKIYNVQKAINMLNVENVLIINDLNKLVNFY